MTSRNHVIVVAVLLVFAIVAAAAYALGDRTGSTRNPTTGPTPGGTAAGSSPTGRTPSAPVSGTVPRTSTPLPTTGGASPVWLPSDPAIADVCRTRLPAQADDTLVLIARGGPYPYRSDGVVFENREGLLPRHTSGYYHEYTVVTPNSDDRGTRRIVTGTAGEQYWTSDHYASFREIDPRC